MFEAKQKKAVELLSLMLDKPEILQEWASAKTSIQTKIKATNAKQREKQRIHERLSSLEMNVGWRLGRYLNDTADALEIEGFDLGANNLRDRYRQLSEAAKNYTDTRNKFKNSKHLQMELSDAWQNYTYKLERFFKMCTILLGKVKNKTPNVVVVKVTNFNEIPCPRGVDDATHKLMIEAIQRAQKGRDTFKIKDIKATASPKNFPLNKTTIRKWLKPMIEKKYIDQEGHKTNSVRYFINRQFITN